MSLEYSRFEIIEWIIKDSPIELHSPISLIAIRYNKLDVLQWFYEAFQVATEGDRVEIIEWLYRTFSYLPENICVRASASEVASAKWLSMEPKSK